MGKKRQGKGNKGINKKAHDIEYQKPRGLIFLSSLSLIIKMEQEEEISEAEVLNDIESRMRKGKAVTDREIRLLVEGYTAFNVPVPKDIQKILKY